MNELGTNTPNGFLPNAPSMEDILSRAGILRDGFVGLSNTMAGKPLAEALAKPGDALKRHYARLFAGVGNKVDADAVLEDIRAQSLGRGMFLPTDGKTIEELIPYFLERNGQNGLAVYLFKMIVDGQSLPAQAAKKAARKK